MAFLNIVLNELYCSLLFIDEGLTKVSEPELIPDAEKNGKYNPNYQESW